mmetsp:Transcript_45008/g.127060  ORF Transcript_45008/g.127060 Transcript_45008/m.127060 type:complete len:119 (+) Transcript_45008:136-492(+)
MPSITIALHCTEKQTKCAEHHLPLFTPYCPPDLHQQLLPSPDIHTNKYDRTGTHARTHLAGLPHHPQGSGSTCSRTPHPYLGPMSSCGRSITRKYSACSSCGLLMSTIRMASLVSGAM